MDSAHRQINSLQSIERGTARTACRVSLELITAMYKSAIACSVVSHLVAAMIRFTVPVDERSRPVL
ncbi:MAG: hypothetical protein ACLR9W_02605 [Enterobacter hormaechei]